MNAHTASTPPFIECSQSPCVVPELPACVSKCQSSTMSHKGFGEVGRQFIPLLREIGFMGQVEGIRLFGFVCQIEDLTEVGEVIGHVVSFLLRVDG